MTLADPPKKQKRRTPSKNEKKWKERILFGSCFSRKNVFFLTKNENFISSTSNKSLNFVPHYPISIISLLVVTLKTQWPSFNNTICILHFPITNFSILLSFSSSQITLHFSLLHTLTIKDLYFYFIFHFFPP